MKKKILIAGGTGLIGSRLVASIDKDKYHIHILSRKMLENTKHISYFVWDVDKMEMDTEAVNVDFIINLTGAGIADKRWTASRKKILVDSRVNSAKLIASGLKAIGHRPEAYISSSAIGYYGDRSDEVLTEESAKGGEGFMVDCCEKWEDAAWQMQNMVNRLAIIRVGIVLSSKGGALPKVLMTRKLGVYNYFGKGNQYYSWIHIDDIVKIFLMALENPQFEGVINGVSPFPETNEDFTKKIKEAFGGIAVLPAPQPILRIALGEMADVILNSTRVVSERLEKVGFECQYSELKAAVRHCVDNDI